MLNYINDKRCDNDRAADSKHSLSCRQSLYIIAHTKKLQSCADNEIHSRKCLYACIHSCITPTLYDVNINRNSNRTNQNNHKAHSRQNRCIRHQHLTQLRFTKHPYCPKKHTPAYILHVKMCLVYNTECYTEHNRHYSSKKNEKCYNRLS